MTGFLTHRARVHDACLPLHRRHSALRTCLTRKTTVASMAYLCCAVFGLCGEVGVVDVGRSEVLYVGVWPGGVGVTGQDAPLGLYLTQDAGRIVQSHVLGDRGMKAREVDLAEVDRVTVGRPLTASVTVAAPGQVGLLIQPGPEELHQFFSHRSILDVLPTR